MATRLNVLIVEDNAHDMGQVVQALGEASYEFDFQQVRVEAEFRAALGPAGTWRFTANQASVRRSRSTCPASAPACLAAARRCC